MKRKSLIVPLALAGLALGFAAVSHGDGSGGDPETDVPGKQTEAEQRKKPDAHYRPSDKSESQSFGRTMQSGQQLVNSGEDKPNQRCPAHK